MNLLYKNTPIISVIIATYNRAHIINHCLQSIVDQSAAQDNFEVIVIDNNSTDNTHDIVLNFKEKITNLQFINETKQGAGHARNAGIAVANGQWIACLDSDAKAHTNWIEIILREVKKGDFECFGGPYLAWHHYGPAPHWFNSEWENSKIDYDYYGFIPKNRGVPTSGNGVFKKSIIKSIGAFPTDIGMKGEKCAYGEETKFFEDMRNAGFKLGSVPDLLVDHCVLPYKYTLTWRLKATFAQGLASPRVKREAFYKYLLELIKQIILLPKRLWRGYQQKHFWQRIFLDSASPILSNLGRVLSCIEIHLKNLAKKILR